MTVDEQLLEGKWVQKNQGEIGRNNARSYGEITIVYANGDLFVGSLQGGKISRNGTMSYKDGTTESGIWSTEGCLGNTTDGQATCLYKDGNRYKGMWKSGKISGQGTYFHNSGTDSGKWKAYDNGVYLGTMREGKPSGKGVMILEEGQRWTGTWKAGNWSKGQYFAKTGKLIQAGQWIEGKCLKKNNC